jgi:hypothetical protein
MTNIGKNISDFQHNILWHCISDKIPFLSRGASQLKQSLMGEQLKCSNIHGINSCLKIEARIMAVYLSALPATRSEQAQSRAYKILLYIPELSPAERGFPFNSKLYQKKTRPAHITSSCYETRDAHTGNCRVYNHLT